MINKVDYGDLPKDILIQVMEKLCWSQRVPSGLVCKTWHESFLEIKNAKEFLPWMMSFDPDSISDDVICKLEDPSARKSYDVKRATKWRNKDLCDADPRASRHGWVLFSKETQHHCDIFGNKSKLFFFNPFTNETIKLPVLQKDFSEKATFSGHPGSTDCMVVAFRSYPGTLYIKTCHPGDRSWKVNKFMGKYTFDSIMDVAYAGDFVYSTFTLYGNLEKKLGAFNIKQQKWKVLSNLAPMSSYRYKALFVAFNGDLTVCCENSHEDRRRLLWRFDLLENKWVVVEGEIMKKQAIFIGCTTFSVPAVENARESAGKICYFCPNLFDFQLVSEDVEWLIKWLTKNYRSEKIWIQPPFQTQTHH